MRARGSWRVKCPPRLGLERRTQEARGDTPADAGGIGVGELKRHARQAANRPLSLRRRVPSDENT